MGLFSKYNAVEKEIVSFKTQEHIAMGMSRSEAKELSEGMIDHAIQISKEQGTYKLPRNLGDIMLGHASSSDPVVIQYADDCMKDLSVYREDEGINEADILSWWNLADVARKLIALEADSDMLATYKNIRKRCKSDKEAMQELRSIKLIFGNPLDLSSMFQGGSDDVPLPFELKSRINTYLEKIHNQGRGNEIFLSKSQTPNAIIRKRIKERAL